MTRRMARDALILACVWAASGAGRADDQVPAAQRGTLSTIVITATRVDALGFDVPASIDRIEGDEVRAGRAQVNLSESLAGVPGLLARDRQNYAQDVQISLRGFGARSTFGIRGVRLYVDGIPATLPDGQGQLSNVELGSVGRIEVLRGPFSALYGNSSGGVIQIFTEEASLQPRLRFDATTGSDNSSRIGLNASGTGGGIGYVLGLSRFRTDGYRDHSAAERTLGNAKLSVRPDDDSKLTLIANSVALPRAQDPLGLTRAQFEAAPRSVDAAAITFDTRKTVAQTQAGLSYERRIDAANAFALTTYTGHRSTRQFQSIPIGPQASPLHSGGVIDLQRDYRGADLRWTWKNDVAGRPMTLVGGLALDELAEHRQGFQNFVPTATGPSLGLLGALRRDENNDVANADQYLQGNWQLTPDWSVSAGVRHSAIRFRSKDAYIVGPNPDDSGGVRYSATLPVVGSVLAITRELHAYVAAGRGFETPTLNELAYRPNGLTGLNLALRASHNTSMEAGVKARSEALGEATAAIFQTDTENEIVVGSNLSGRTSYRNAGATRRTGMELSWTNYFLDQLRAQVAATVLDAQYRDAFSTCIAAPCAASNLLVPAGRRIPGIARTSLFAALSWLPPQGWRWGTELRYLGRVFVNDSNTDAAKPYLVAAAHFGYIASVGPWQLGGLVRVDNLFARRYAGSVIVNEGNGRYFEPAPGRTWLVGATASLQY
ncbi:MAG: TonB-dependent receptor [Burkholderiaceae bacterium]